MDKLDIEIKFADEANDSGHFKGIASTESIDYGRDIVELDGVKAKTPMQFWWNHDKSDLKNLIGAISTITKTAEGLEIEGQLRLKQTPLAQQAYDAMREGLLTGLSIGFVPTKHHWDDEKSARVLEEIDLKEVSLVPIGMNREAQLTDVKEFTDEADAEAATDEEAEAAEAQAEAESEAEAKLAEAEAKAVNKRSLRRRLLENQLKGYIR